MTPFQAIILGLVEGITEYLPISSTGHLIITTSLLGLDGAEIKRSMDAFNIVIQGGAILAVVGLYWPRIVQMIRGILGKDALGAKLFMNLIIAFLPAAVIGLVLAEIIEEYLFRPGPVLAALALGGVWMIYIDRWHRRRELMGVTASLIPGGGTIDTMTPVQAFGIGLFQCVSMWPGTSRSMMTIAGGMMLGLRGKEAAQFSFLLGLPTLGAACLYKLAKNLKEAHDAGTPNLFEQLGIVPVLLGMAMAAIAAAVAVKWLVAFLNRHGLGAFGWYRIVLTIVMAALLWRGVISI